MIQTKKFAADSFYEMLFYQSFLKNSKNLREYEILQLKSRRIGNLTQKNFDMIMTKERENLAKQ